VTIDTTYSNAEIRHRQSQMGPVGLGMVGLLDEANNGRWLHRVLRREGREIAGSLTVLIDASEAATSDTRSPAANFQRDPPPRLRA